MANMNNLGDLQKAVAPRLPSAPRPYVRTAHRLRRRPRWLGGDPL